jgi:hypothetical protein
MYKRSRENYCRIAENYGLTLIPGGDVIQNIRKHPEFDVTKGGLSICRDGFHMHYIYGRYALACTWAKTLLDAPIRKCTYIPQCYETKDVPDEKLLSLVLEEVVNI